MDQSNKKRGGRRKGQADFRILPPGHIPAKEAALLRARFVDGATLADAAMVAGYQCSNRQSAAVLASKVIEKHRNANGELMEALEQAGISVEELATKISEGLEATVTLQVGRGVFRELPDHRTRHRYIETCLDIMGARAPKKVEVEDVTFEQRLLAIITADETG